MDEEGDMEYVVEKILDKKIDSNGTANYRVKWERYPPSENTWEPLKHIADCDVKLKEFEIRQAEMISDKVKNRTNPKMTASKNTTSAAASTSSTSPDDMMNIEQEKEKEKVKERKPKNQTYKVNEILGITVINDEKFFLISVIGKSEPYFIRATLANTIIPHKVIDFYMAHITWREAPSKLTTATLATCPGPTASTVASPKTKVGPSHEPSTEPIAGPSTEPTPGPSSAPDDPIETPSPNSVVELNEPTMDSPSPIMSVDLEPQPEPHLKAQSEVQPEANGV